MHWAIEGLPFTGWRIPLRQRHPGVEEVKPFMARVWVSTLLEAVPCKLSGIRGPPARAGTRQILPRQLRAGCAAHLATDVRCERAGWRRLKPPQDVSMASNLREGFGKTITSSSLRLDRATRCNCTTFGASPRGCSDHAPFMCKSGYDGLGRTGRLGFVGRRGGMTSMYIFEFAKLHARRCT